MPVFDGATFNLQDPSMIVALTSVVAVVLLIAVHRALLFRMESNARKVAEVLKQERDELEERADRLEAIKEEIDGLNAELSNLATEKLRTLRRKKKKPVHSRLFVHEIGGREPGRKQFEFPLQAVPAVLRMNPTKVIFHPDIWKFKNEAHVWAADYPVAQMLTSSVFNGTNGVVIAAPTPDAAEPDDPADAGVAGLPPDVDPSAGMSQAEAASP